MGVGPGQHQRLGRAAPTRAASRRPEHAAGDRQPVRRHGRPAGHAASRADRRRRRPPTRPRRRSTITSPPPAPTCRTAPRPRSPAPRPTPAAGSSPASRSPPTAARPGIRRPHRGGRTSLDLQLGRAREPRRPRSRSRAVDDSGNLETPVAGHTVNVNCPCSIWGTDVTPEPRLGRRQLDRGRRQVHDRHLRHHQRHPLLQGHHQHRHAHRQPVDRDRPAARPGHLHRRNRSGWQQVNFSAPGADQPQHHLRRVLLRPEGHYSADEGYFYPHPGRPPDATTASTARRCTRCATPAAPPTASTRTRTHHLPDQHLQRRELLGRLRSSRRPRRAGPGHQRRARPRATPRRPSAGPPRRPAGRSRPTPSRRTSARPRRPRRRSPGSPRRPARRHRPHQRHARTRSRSPPPTRTASGPAVRAVERGHAVSERVAVVQRRLRERADELGGRRGGSAGASTAKAHSRQRLGAARGLSGTEPAGDSTLSQTVTVPSGGSTLTFWYWPATTDEICSGCRLQSTTGRRRRSAAHRARRWPRCSRATRTRRRGRRSASTRAPTPARPSCCGSTCTRTAPAPPDDTSMYLDDVSLTGTSPTAPGAPTEVTATAGNGAATVSWTAPAATAAARSRSYTVTPYIGSTAQTPTTVTGSPPATTTTVTGLTNGTSLHVHRHRHQRDRDRSGLQPPPTPSPRRAADRAGGADERDRDRGQRRGDRELDRAVRTAAARSRATRSRRSSARPRRRRSRSRGSPPATTATVTGLTNGTSLHLHRHRHQRDRDRSGLGRIQRRHADRADAAGGADERHRDRGQRHGDGELDRARSNGGSAITSYTVTPFIGTTAQTPTTITGSPPATSATITGLTNGTTYTFTVTATNAIGTGPPSSASNAVTPSATARRRSCSRCQRAGPASRAARSRRRPTSRRATGSSCWSASGAAARDRQERDRRGRQHLHRGPALQGVRQHRDERLDRADHGGRRHATDDHRDADRHGRRRRRGARVLRTLTAAERRLSIDQSASVGHDRRRRHGQLRRDRGDNREQRACRRLLRRFRVRRHVDGRIRLHRARQRLQGLRHGAAGRGSVPAPRRHAQCHRRHRREHGLADVDDRVQARLSNECGPARSSARDATDVDVRGRIVRSCRGRADVAPAHCSGGGAARSTESRMPRYIQCAPGPDSQAVGAGLRRRTRGSAQGHLGPVPDPQAQGARQREIAEDPGITPDHAGNQSPADVHDALRRSR